VEGVAEGADTLVPVSDAVPEQEMGKAWFASMLAASIDWCTDTSREFWGVLPDSRAMEVDAATLQYD
jgi:hypothetical protein